MSYSRWDPFEQFSFLRNNMDRMVNDFFGEPRRLYMGNGSWSHVLPIDMYETPNEFVIKAHVPGVDPSQVNITAEHGTLTISAHLPSDAEQEEAKDWRWHNRETWFGELSRTITLPGQVDADKAEASFHNGMLTLKLPKVEAARPRQIPISTEYKQIS